MIAAAVIAAVCAWNTPGANPTTSLIPATLAAMGIDSPELARKIAAGEYDELVTMRRNDRRAYGMTSGNAKWCAGEIDTSRWAADHEEQGRVYRVGDLAVVWYWRCRNMSLWRAPVVGGWTPIAAGPTYLDAPDLRTGGPLGTGPGYASAIPLAPAIASPSGYSGAPWGAAAGFGYAVYLRTECACCGPAAVPAVAEPGTWALVALGVALMAWRVRR